MIVLNGFYDKLVPNLMRKIRSRLCQFLILIIHHRTPGFLNVPIKFSTPGPESSPEHPILVLDNKAGKLVHHSNGIFTNPIRRTAFEFKGEEGTVSEDILEIDARFVSLLKWLGENQFMCGCPGR